MFLKLTRQDDLIGPATRPEEAPHFSFYLCDDPDNGLNIFLISNKYQGNILIPEQKAADYFLVIKGYLSPETFALYIQVIRKLNQVITAFSISPSGKKIDQFLEDLELHTIDIQRRQKGLLNV